MHTTHLKFAPTMTTMIRMRMVEGNLHSLSEPTHCMNFPGT